MSLRNLVRDLLRRDDLQARLEKVEAERDEARKVGERNSERSVAAMVEYQDRATRAEAALEESAAEFERRAERALANRDCLKPTAKEARVRLEDVARGHRSDAQLLREKLAGLKVKGGGAGEE